MNITMGLSQEAVKLALGDSLFFMLKILVMGSKRKFKMAIQQRLFRQYQGRKSKLIGLQGS
ncbi:hypothetical protein [Planococcus ruber]|uniref:hypothetical protein n=1 Tax=Planococcus ruber TaxID=2027871 RepID=UPI001FED2A93|nr:hypothetical protein [Planococcus ruber]MCJ1907680.1 hypothetical protein [Planococcus ruber]